MHHCICSYRCIEIKRAGGASHILRIYPVAVTVSHVGSDWQRDCVGSMGCVIVNQVSHGVNWYNNGVIIGCILTIGHMGLGGISILVFIIVIQ